jgi:hypothetical protein
MIGNGAGITIAFSVGLMSELLTTCLIISSGKNMQQLMVRKEDNGSTPTTT